LEFRVPVCRLAALLCGAVVCLLLAAAGPVAPVVTGLDRVRDGDTIVVGGVPVRLSGLHCPEKRETGGAAATAAIASLARRAEVACELTGRRSYDRHIGQCRAGDTDLADALIRQGHCARCPRHDREGRYRAAQAAAGPWRGTIPGYC
jgi:endonuclease YncB( thermonuclease family)